MQIDKDMYSDRFSLSDTKDDLLQMHDEIVLRLAMMQLADRENENLMASMDVVELESAYSRYVANNDATIKKAIGNAVRKAGRPQNRRTVLRILQAAAILIAIFAIVTTTAAATVPAFRAQVMTLLFTIEENYTEVQLQKSSDNGFDLPPDWEGEYFPYYIPKGFELYEVDQHGGSYDALFYDAEGNLLEFCENNYSTVITVDTEDATNEYMQLNNSLCLISTKADRIMIVWMHKDKYFDLTFYGDKNEAITIAESVMHIK